MSPELIPMIHTVRGCQVMLDRDLAELYQTETRSLKQSVSTQQGPGWFFKTCILFIYTIRCTPFNWVLCLLD